MLKELANYAGAFSRDCLLYTSHLGLDWTLKDPEDKYSVDFEKPVCGGPTSLGFDYFYGISASLDMPPYVYLENDRVTAPPDREESNWWDKGNSYNKQIFRPGPVGSDFHQEEVFNRMLDRTMETLEAWKNEPFFLYVPLTAPHTPIPVSYTHLEPAHAAGGGFKDAADADQSPFPVQHAEPDHAHRAAAR